MNILAAANINNPVFGSNLAALNGVTFIQGLTRAAISGALSIGVIIFFFNLLIGGVMYINSGGDKGKTEAARSKITNALIGIVVMVSVFAITIIVGNILGIDLLVLNLDSIRIK